MDGELLKKRGRPRKDDGRIRVVNVRLTEEEFRDVLHFAGRFECTYSDVLRRALDEYVRSMRA